MVGALNDSGDYGFNMSFQDTKRIFNKHNQRNCPRKVKVVDRPKDNLTALLKLFNNETYPKRLLWEKDVCTNQYGFWDVSGSGFLCLVGGSGRREEMSERELEKYYVWEVFETSRIKELDRDTRKTRYGR